ncbi:MAG: hypothetical protein OJF59_000917 [Cytophagales bacterium]|jgi:hypothetical protein|nr:hypothetical protein [Bacteroidota bacterium]MBS1980083.1 hypothetical protein [Bacteroidota bacterium]WHZ07164.1 MAG: hypothetical protein OJF59_000917 [Cytophagales bacterium]
MKKVLVLMGVFFFSVSCWAQFNPSFRKNNNNQSQDSRKVYFAMGGGLGFGTDASGFNYNYYSLLPMVGYRITNQVSVGAMGTYQRYNYSSIGTSYTQYGAGPFVRYMINPIFFQAEYDMISAPNIYKLNANGEPTRSTFSRMLFGVGYIFSSGQRVSLGGLVMYDVLYHVPSVFASPIVTRIFVSF